jgi:uncharacterized membrane protein (UPF0127 family)
MKNFKEYYNESPVPVPLHEGVEPDTLSLNLNDSTYELEIADTPDKIIQGLSGRDFIPRKTGMIFIMPREQVQEFWMKDCLTNMDIIFLNEEGQIVNMHRMLKERPRASFETNEDYATRLTSYSSGEPAKYAIEIPAGDITRLGLRIGQIVPIHK